MCFYDENDNPPFLQLQRINVLKTQPINIDARKLEPLQVFKWLFEFEMIIAVINWLIDFYIIVMDHQLQKLDNADYETKQK